MVQQSCDALRTSLWVLLQLELSDQSARRSSALSHNFREMPVLRHKVSLSVLLLSKFLSCLSLETLLLHWSQCHSTAPGGRPLS